MNDAILSVPCIPPPHCTSRQRQKFNKVIWDHHLYKMLRAFRLNIWNREHPVQRRQIKGGKKNRAFSLDTNTQLKFYTRKVRTWLRDTEGKKKWRINMPTYRQWTSNYSAIPNMMLLACQRFKNTCKNNRSVATATKTQTGQQNTPATHWSKEICPKFTFLFFFFSEELD